MVEGSDCPSGKGQFASKAAARTAAGGQRARGENVSAYRCLLCGSAAVTEMPAADKKVGRR